jgi:hypothetical protein
MPQSPLQSPLTIAPKTVSPVVPSKTVEQARPTVEAAAGDGKAEPTFLGYPLFTWQKIIPLGLMFFCILFNYTILRDTKVSGRPASSKRRPRHRRAQGTSDMVDYSMQWPFARPMHLGRGIGLTGEPHGAEIVSAWVSRPSRPPPAPAPCFNSLPLPLDRRMCWSSPPPVQAPRSFPS